MIAKLMFLYVFKMEHEKEAKSHVDVLPVQSENLLYLPESNVRDLQNVLFPITPRKCYSTESYLSYNYLKKLETRQEEEEKVNFLKSPDAKDYFPKEFTSLEYVGQPPRWPTECQVLEERIKHIPYKPCPPEPYYCPTGNEVQPKPIGEEAGIIVYQYYPISAVNYFCRSSIGGSKYLLPTCPAPAEESLRFESRFESGNLAKAIKITANYYELYLRTDLYTNRHMQWFYFKVSNMKKGTLYRLLSQISIPNCHTHIFSCKRHRGTISGKRFSIVNFTKGDSLYSEGMRPLMYSEQDAQIHSIGWRRCGSNITYFCNDNTSPEEPEQLQYYTLTFTMEFPHDNDVAYLAHSYPYTYSDLQDYLLDIAAHPIKSTYTTLRLLCKTLAGNNVYCVTVTSPPEESSNKKKKSIVITARVHPGESPSSWMMHGFLDFLTSDTGPAKELRDNFLFKLVPMLNPDGVIVGNNRCSLTGKDLNRQYRTVIRETYPSIWYTKLMIRRLIDECGVAMYCDLHAHSKRHNIFIFGCENKGALDKKLYEQVFPLMLHKNASEKFSFENCKFRIQKCKEGTGRVVMWMMGIANSFTMEASFGGSTLGSRAETHFNTLDFEQMGKSFCQTLLDFYDEEPKKERLRLKIINRLAKEGSNADEPANIRLSDYSSDGGDTTTSSDDGDERRVINIPETAPPPPTPTKTKKSVFSRKLVTKSHSKQSRKPLQVCKADLMFSCERQRSNTYSTDYSSGSDSEPYTRKINHMPRKKKKKKKPANKKLAIVDLSDTEVQVAKQYNILDLITGNKYITKPPIKKEHITRNSNENKPVNNYNYQHILDLHKKLHLLKKKMWLGIGDTNARTPLWGSVPSKGEGRISAKKTEKTIKAPTKKLQKPKEEIKEKPVKKTKDNFKRQTAIEIAPIKTTAKLRKSKSLMDNSKKDSKYNRTNNMKILNFDKFQEGGEIVAGKNKSKKKPKTAKISHRIS